MHLDPLGILATGVNPDRVLTGTEGVHWGCAHQAKAYSCLTQHHEALAYFGRLRSTMIRTSGCGM